MLREGGSGNTQVVCGRYTLTKDVKVASELLIGPQDGIRMDVLWSDGICN